MYAGFCAVGVSKGLVEVVKSAQKEKVVRVGLLSLRNLLGEPELGAASDMVEAGLTKVLATRGLQVRVVGTAERAF
jgi:hypothetical protein